jgi:Spy/CpxP family protein refolding chaperone
LKKCPIKLVIPFSFSQSAAPDFVPHDFSESNGVHMDRWIGEMSKNPILGGIMKSNFIAPIAMATALAFTTLAAGAQTQPSSAPTGATAEHHRQMPDADHQLQRMTKHLNLTEAQQQQIKPILVDRDQRMQAIQSDTTLSADQRHQSMGKLMHDSSEQVRNVLTDTQRQQWDEARQRMHEHRHGEPASSPTATTPPPPAM